jgi:hypothetical protein
VLSPAATFVDFSAVWEQAAAPSVSQSAVIVTVPHLRVFTRRGKDFPEKRKNGDPLALHIRCQTGYPQARPHLA